MCSDDDTHRWVGCPIRISTDQSLLAAPHGFSQRATSFVASWCQGIHRMPLSRSKPPHTHRNHPHPGMVQSFHSAGRLTHLSALPVLTARRPLRSGSRKTRHATSAQRMLEPSLTGRGRDPSAPGHPEHTLPSLDAPVRITTIIGSDTQSRPRTETHQPLHTDKEHRNTGSTPQDAARSLGFPVTITRRSNSTPQHQLVEADGIEPTTPCLQSRCSAN